MGTNNYRAHVHILPEDDADRELANGFILGVLPAYSRAIQVLPPAGGWIKLLDEFRSFHMLGMRTFPLRQVVLLIDFDDDLNRVSWIKRSIPEDLSGRVFVLGALGEPEDLRKDFGPDYESIGQRLAEDCRDGTSPIWNHPQLRHNLCELDRLRQYVRPLLFP